MVDDATRATEQQWRELLSQCAALADELADNGTAAFNAGTRPADGYPSGSMPDSAIAKGRVSDPTGWTVERHSTAKDRPCKQHDTVHCPDCHGTLVLHGSPCASCRDSWLVMPGAIRRMVTETADACNRVASAHYQSFIAQGLGGGQLYSVVEKSDAWVDLVVKLSRGIDALKACARDVRDAPKTPESLAARRQMERELLDASNRLRTATSAMRDMLPTPIPEKAREVCPGCGTPRDIVTYFGQIPQYWVVNEGKCRECVLRPTRVAKGPQQPGNARAQKRARARRAS